MKLIYLKSAWKYNSFDVSFNAPYYSSLPRTVWYVIKIGKHVWTWLSKTTKGIQVRISENSDGTIELNQNTLCLYRLSKGCKSRMKEYISLKLSGNDKEIFAYWHHYYSCHHYDYYHFNLFTIFRG